MPKRRANGEGNIRKRKDGRWEGRYTVGHDPETGKAIIKNVLGKTQAEVKEKLKKAIEENVGIDYGRAKTYTVGSWLEVWMENYAKIGNVKKCAVGKHPKSEKHGNTAQFSKVERSGTQENCGGIGSGCRLRLRPLPVLRRRQWSYQ